MPARPAAGGGRWVEVAPQRLRRWLDGFAERHGSTSFVAGGGPALTARGRGPTVTAGSADLTLIAADGAVAELFAPPGMAVTANLDQFLAAALADRRVGLLLARQASVALGVAEGARLVVAKVDTSYVQGRTAAGGWSQQRFARRRVNQAKAAAGSAADLAVRLLLPAANQLDTLVTGGDRRAVAAVLDDARLGPLRALRAERFLDVAQPRRAVLEQAVDQARAVLIRVRDPRPA